MQFNLKIQKLVMEYAYFAGFRPNNSVFMQNSCGFNKYQLWKKFIFWQLVAKILNCADIRQNNSSFTHTHTKRILKLAVGRNHEFCSWLFWNKTIR